MYIQTISAHTSQRTQFASIKSDESANAAQENNGCLSCESYGAYAMCKHNSDYLVLNLSCVQRLGQHRTEWDMSEPQTAFFIVELLSIGADNIVPAQRPTMPPAQHCSVL